jgi:hypothetical protein
VFLNIRPLILSDMLKALSWSLGTTWTHGPQVCLRTYARQSTDSIFILKILCHFT